MRNYLLVFLLLMSQYEVMAQKELPIGSIAPEISASDYRGAYISLKELRASGPVVVLFYRGEWCRYCNMQMSNLADSMDLFKEYHVSLIAITPEKNEYIKKTATETGVPFSVIYDKDHEIMDSYRVSWQMGKLNTFFYKISGKDIVKASGSKDRILPVPATYIIGMDGKITGSFFEEDHTKRMSVARMLEILEDHQNN